MEILGVEMIKSGTLNFGIETLKEGSDDSLKFVSAIVWFANRGRLCSTLPREISNRKRQTEPANDRSTA